MELLPPLRSNMYRNMNIFDRTGGIVDASDDKSADGVTLCHYKFLPELI